MSCLAKTDPRPEALVVVYDGCPKVDDLQIGEYTYDWVEITKHVVGHEQPRNIGVRALRDRNSTLTHVWFLDSDLIFEPDILGAYERAYAANPVREIVAPHRAESSREGYVDRILMGPYEWLAPEVYEPQHQQHNDIRWASFNEHGPDVALIHDLGSALGCFGGNLVWPIDEFQKIGGFHPQLSHGRVEDGELGLRAAAAGIPMSLVKDARAWHVAHNINMAWCMHVNANEVPLLNSWHPWVQDRGLILTESDGARFDFVCSEPGCDLIFNSHDYWNHLAQHRAGEPFTFADPASVRHAA